MLEGAEQVYLSVPSQSLRENLRIVRELIPPDAIVVSLMKGVEMSTGSRMSEVIAQELGIDARAHRRRLRPQPRPRDREGAADRGRRLVESLETATRRRA